MRARFFWFGLMSLAACHPQEKRTLQDFVKIVDAPLIQTAYAKLVTVSFETKSLAQEIHWGGRVDLHSTDPEAYDAYSIRITPAGILWPVNETADPQLKIGQKARQEFISFSPEGATYGITFTTTDGKWDVRIIRSQHLGKKDVDPEFNAEKLARAISARYDLLKT